MHRMAALTCHQPLSETRPSAQALEKCKQFWAHVALTIGDEGSQMDPNLLATACARAYYGRIQKSRWDIGSLPEHPFGDILMQVLLADFLQLNPVKSHTLLEALIDTKDYAIPGVPAQTLPLTFDGYKIFRQSTRNVILLKGTHRFLPDDPLA